MTVETCIGCGSTAVTYHNYESKPFCGPCADGCGPNDPPRKTDLQYAAEKFMAEAAKTGLTVRQAAEVTGMLTDIGFDLVVGGDPEPTGFDSIAVETSAAVECYCGEQATVVRTNDSGVKVWSCAEHYGVIGWEIPRDGGAPIPIAWAA